MLIFGLLLVCLAALAVVGAAFLTEGQGIEYAGVGMEPLTLYLAGAVTMAVLWLGLRLVKAGTRRGLRRRRENKRMAEQLDRAEGERRRDEERGRDEDGNHGRDEHRS